MPGSQKRAGSYPQADRGISGARSTCHFALKSRFWLVQTATKAILFRWIDESVVVHVVFVVSCNSACADAGGSGFGHAEAGYLECVVEKGCNCSRGGGAIFYTGGIGGCAGGFSKSTDSSGRRPFNWPCDVDSQTADGERENTFRFQTQTANRRRHGGFGE